MSLHTLLSRNLAHLPEPIRPIVEKFYSGLAGVLEAKHLAIFDNEAFAASVLKVCACSQFVSESWLREPALLPGLVNSGDLFSSSRREAFTSELQSLLPETEVELTKAMRLFRRREMVRIAWRDLAGWADLDETLADLTALAEACIQTALDFLYR